MPLLSGQLLTHYELLGPLGAGGMGEVYRARDTRLGREVAIKVLPEELADSEERLRRFELEAKTTIELNPSNSDWLAGMGTAYSQLGFFEEGTALVLQAQFLNPTPMPWLFMTLFLDHYSHGRYGEALAEALRTETSDFRSPLFRAAAYGQLGESEKARADLDELKRYPATDTTPEIRELLIRRNGYVEELAELLLEGLKKAGFE